MIAPNCFNFRGLNSQEMEMQLANAAGSVKLTMGVCNNVAYLLLMNALDKIKKHPKYKQQVKKAFGHALDEWHRYEHTLMYAPLLRFFHVADMTPEVRKRYRDDLTDTEYYEYWTGTGGAAYNMTQMEINSLRHKYYLSVSQHNVPHAEELSYVMVAQAGLALAVKIHRSYMGELMKATGIPAKILTEVFAQFSLNRVSNAWMKAMLLIEPQLFEYDLDEADEKNIMWGLTQLEEKWENSTFIYDAMRGAVEDFPEVFRTKGEMKKQLKQIETLRNKTKEYEKD